MRQDQIGCKLFEHLLASLLMTEHAFFTPLDQNLFESRIVQVSGPVGSELAYKTNKALLAMEKASDKESIFLFINSPGGEITSGFSIYDTARFIKPKVYTVVVGMAASMGSIIALSAPAERRLAFPNAKFLIHQPLISGTIQGSASEIEIHAKDIVATRERINQLYAQETGKSVEEIAKATDRDNWMTAAEAKDFGLVSKIINKRTDLK